MNYYIESSSTDSEFNLALEQFIFDSLDRRHSYFMLWQNNNSIIVGKHQNTLAEINSTYVSRHNINVVRRLSGGGAVYHDLGNLNFTFITDTGENRTIDFTAFCKPIQKALVSFGIPVEISGRNDMTVEGKKISGNAQYIKENRVMHHGTILYDSDLSVLSKALNPGSDKIESKGIKSVQSRVANIKPYIKTDMTIKEFWQALKNFISDDFNLNELKLTDAQKNSVLDIKEKIYSRWSWNYGKSPAHTMRKIRRIEGCGKIEILFDIAREGIINNIAFYGDFFSSRDSAELSSILTGHCFEYNEIKNLQKDININEYFHALNYDDFLALLFE